MTRSTDDYLATVDELLDRLAREVASLQETTQQLRDTVDEVKGDADGDQPDE